MSPLTPRKGLCSSCSDCALDEFPDVRFHGGDDLMACLCCARVDAHETLHHAGNMCRLLRNRGLRFSVLFLLTLFKQRCPHDLDPRRLPRTRLRPPLTTLRLAHAWPAALLSNRGAERLYPRWPDRALRRYIEECASLSASGWTG
jgi:hypothetical protein